MANAWESAPLVAQKAAWESAPLVGAASAPTKSAPAERSFLSRIFMRDPNTPEPPTLFSDPSAQVTPEATRAQAIAPAGFAVGATADIGNALLNMGVGGAEKLKNVLTSPSLSDLVTGKRALSPIAQWNADRSHEIDTLPQQFQNPADQAAFGTGRLVGNGVATMPVGGVVANTIARIPGAATAVPGFINAVRTGGMATGAAPLAADAALSARIAAGAKDLALRSAGGAVTGGATMALVDPAHADAGVAIGAGLPPALKLAGGVAAPIGAAVRNALMPREVAGAQDIANALGVTSPQDLAALVAKLRGAETLVPGSGPTVAQALQTPQASILQRVVHDSPGASVLQNKLAQQGQARLNALEGVAPTQTGGYAQAQADLGNSIERTMVPEEKLIGRRVSQQYSAVDAAKKETINLPVDEMQAAVDKYAGRGTFSASADPVTAAATARSLAAPATPQPASAILDASGAPMRAAGEAVPRAATWDEVGNLRASINKALRDATTAGDRQAVGALTAQKQAIDAAINRDLSPQARATWLEANASHANKMDRFHTGPQASIFRVGSDGLPAKQGGEIAQAFWGQRPGLAEDVQSFRRLVDDSPALLGQFKSLITTHGAGTADAAGNLTTKFSKWVTNTLPGLRGAFSPEEVQTLQRIAQDIDRAATTNKLGTSLGGSNTYQNAANALSLGMLDSPMLSKAASVVPGVRLVAAPALEGVRGMARNAKATRMAELLADNEASANALEMFSKRQPSGQNALLNALVPTVYRGAPRARSGSP